MSEIENPGGRRRKPIDNNIESPPTSSNKPTPPGFVGPPPNLAPKTHKYYGSNHSGFSAIKAMQQAMITFGTELSKNYLMSMPQNDNKAPSKANPFANFLVSQYVNNANVVGQQFVNIDLTEPKRSQTASPNKSLPGIISTIGRVGTPGNERGTDGIWQTRTNNSLKQIYAVGAALLQFQKDMKVNVAGYDDKDLAELKSEIPNNYTDLGNTGTKRAEVITPNIQKLMAFYQEFEKAILNNPSYKNIITQDKPLVTYNKPEDFTDDEYKLLNSWKTGKLLPVATLGKSEVYLNDLTNMADFKKMLVREGLKADDPNVVNKSLQMIKAKLEGTHVS